ncbi:MAG TPA: hypothetical protein VMV94_03780 [Phycisphaerae bacterium]|nr:hypothetical protein [Phycisphaerae bacterium]
MSRLMITSAFLLVMAAGYAEIRAANDPPAGGNRASREPRRANAPDERAPGPRRYAWESDVDYEVRCRLSRRVPRIELNQVELQDALERMARLCDVSVAPNWAALDAAGISKDTEISIAATNVCGDDLLAMILDIAGAGETQLAFDVSRGVVEVSTREDLSRATMTCTYECADLLYADDEELARYIDRVVKALAKYGNVSLSRDKEAMERVVRAAVREARQAVREELLQAVNSCVDPESWRDHGGNIPNPVFVGTQMVVTQTRMGQMEVDDLLEALRAKMKKPTNRL